MQGSTSSRRWSHIVLVLIAVFASAFAWGQGGTVVGTIHLTGTPPPNPIIKMGVDPNCLKMNAGKRVVQDIVVTSNDGGLKNAFVYLQGSFPGSKATSDSVTIEMQNCNYQPRVIGASVGQTLTIKNDDATLHNVKSVSQNYHFNQGMPSAGLTMNVPLKTEEIALHLKCNVHPWMSGLVGIASSPYYAVSDETGKFKIDNVPAGKQTIVVWHERYGPLTQTVDVQPGASVTADFTYTGKELAPVASNSNFIQEVTIPEGTTSVSFIPPAR